ncbi:uncharacterized protein F4812DRAFT_470524 [Daldinia caldariorum]|uniref:uncharacterized protein n=1 Tax=Daldinia caldariorum TaxID=326644 RepID=UPI0020082AE6|nr:uncharacterized protein F4812DRAFT_470524 [Daldinia caldariorum]KAI1468688.1 hypothetical protein F4812DRAFT_470524 [Daldinia caldariorum]
MGNCMSTCGGNRPKSRVPSDVEIRNVHIRMATLSGNKGEENSQPEQYVSEEQMPQVGIALTSNDVINMPDPTREGTIHQGRNQELASTRKEVTFRDFNQESRGRSRPVVKESQFFTESLESIPIDDVPAGTAAPVDSGLPVQHRLITSTSAYNIRDLGDLGDTSDVIVQAPPGLRPSATMSNLNKPLPKYPDDDPVAAYIERENLKLEKFWKIIVPEKAFMVDFKRERNLIRGRPIQEVEEPKDTAVKDEEDEKSVDKEESADVEKPVDDKRGSIKSVKKAKEESVRGLVEEVNEHNQEAKALVRILRQKIWQYDERILNLEAERAFMRKGISIAGNGSSSRQLTTSSIAGQSNNAARPLTETSYPDIPVLEGGKMNIPPCYYFNSPRMKARKNHFPPPGGLGPSSSTNFPVPSTAAERAAPSQEKSKQQIFRLPVRPEPTLYRIPNTTQPPKTSTCVKERDDELYAAALKKVTDAYNRDKPEIRHRVRNFIVGEHNTAKATETILAMEDDIINSCIHGDEWYETVRRLVNGCCERHEQVQFGLISHELGLQLDTESQATKRRKAVALMAKWTAEAEEQPKAEEKGKDKEKTD